MPFDVLSALMLSDAPNNVAATNITNLSAEEVANVDVAGGSAQVIGDLDAGTATIRYTNSEGAISDFTVELPEGFVLTSDQGVILDGETSTFTFAIAGPSEESDDTIAGMFNVVIDTTGDPTLSATQSYALEVEVFVDEETGGPFVQQDYSPPLSLQPLGNGQLAFYDINGNAGAVSMSDTNSPQVSYLVLADPTLDLKAHTIGLGDGKTVTLSQIDAGVEGSLEFTVSQTDAFSNTLASETLSFTDELAALGLEPATTDVAVVIDANGELAFSFTEEDVTYSTTIDLLPASDEPLIEPPLPPVDLDTPTAGDDVLTLTSGDDVIDALGGDDAVKGLGGKDWIIGGDGNDSIDGGRGDDIASVSFEENPDGDLSADGGGLFGGAGDDSINGRMGNDFIGGGDGNDDLRGGLGGDAYGAPGSETRGGLYGGAGDDFIRGNRGKDWLEGGVGNDDLNGGFGDDEVRGGDGDDKVSGFDGSDTIFGGDGNDMLHGGRGDDSVFGGSGDDVMRGGDGADRLVGLAGDDMLIGGAGADVFSALIATRSAETGELVQTFDNGTNTIKDFTIGEDKIGIVSGYSDVDVDEIADLPPAIGFDDLFLSQEESFAVIQAGETTFRLKGVDVEDLDEDDFLFE